MDFQFSEEQKMLRSAARDFLAKEIVPLVDEHERRGPLSKEEATGFIKRLTPLGYIVGLVPEEYGGLELDLVSYAMLLEELSYAWAGLASIINIAGALPLALTTRGTEEQRAKFLARSLSGEIIGCGAITEPDSGSDAPRGIKTKAVLDGDEWVVNGTKVWITNGTIADVVNLLTWTDFGQGAQGISSLLVEKEVSPFSARELNKLGLKAAPTAELSFADCRVPKGNLLGEPEAGPRITLAGFEFGRSSLGIRACGIAQAAIDAAIRYARERKQFGRPIGSFQMIQEMIADMIAETEAGRLLSLHAFYLLSKGERCRKESSMAKAYCTEMAVGVTSKAIQIHGAMGLSDEYPVERYFRDARTMTIPDGTTQIQKLIVGREVLGIKAFT